MGVLVIHPNNYRSSGVLIIRGLTAHRPPGRPRVPAPWDPRGAGSPFSCLTARKC